MAFWTRLRLPGGGTSRRDRADRTRRAPVPEDPATAAASEAADAPPATPADVNPRPLTAHALVRAGVYAWALIGVVLALVGLTVAVSELRVIAVPLVLALFPAALLSPLVRWLVVRRVPPALASLLVIIGTLGVIVGVVSLLAPAIAAELPGLAESVQQGIAQLQDFLEEGPFGIDPAVIAQWLEAGREQLVAIAQDAAGAVASAVAEGVAGVLFAFVALFFYLKDGGRIAGWLASVFPEGLRQDAEAIGGRAWVTIGSYFRGQLFVALVDAAFIGLGLLLLQVPLALPLAVLVFFGGLFPIVGAFVSGTVAVLVALADGGLGIALAVLAIVVAVQQVESNVLAPVVLGKATQLHPLAVILALAAGGILLGVLGAFLAVPVAASLTRAVGHLRNRKRLPTEPVSPAARASAAGR